MAYRLSLDTDDPAGDLRRCAREQLLDAASGLRDGDTDRVTATHEARKDLKKGRSLLRLARRCLPADAYSVSNARLRDIGRGLAGARDADVLVETAERLGERHPGRLPATAFAALRAHLATGAQRARAGTDGQGGQGGEPALATLDAVAEEAAAWPFDGCDVEALAAGAGRAYRRGRRAMGRAERRPTTENLHEWRKRVKDLWYHSRLLEEAWPKVLKAQAKEAHRLSDVLGDDHDLAALAAELDAGGSAAAVALDEATLRALIADDRSELQARAWRIGRRIYAERPKAYERRLAQYVRAAAPPPAELR